MSLEFVEIESELLNGEYRHIGRRYRKGRLRRVVRARHTSIRRDEHLAESSRHVGKAYRHGEPPARPSWRRLTFQISPHRSHRQ
jgi:hypothetical protein